MKRFLAFLKATLIGGVIVVLPAWLAVLLVLKTLGHLQIFVKPVSSHLPQTMAHPRVIAILILIALCFLVGAAIQTAIGRKAERAAERAVLEKIPGYDVLRSLASRLSHHAETASSQPALVEIEEALVPGFIVERHSGNRSTVFIPSVPTPMAGAVHIIDTKVQKNPDGSTDIYFDPKAPAGKESNWVATDPKRQFELLFHLHGPREELFEKTWKLPDIEEMQ